MTRPQPWDPVEANVLHRGPARYETRSIDLPIRKGKTRPSRSAIASAIATTKDAIGADAHLIVRQERMGYDEFQITVLLFWRTDADPS